MIIVMTNRELNKKPVNDPIDIAVEELGVVLAERTNDGDVLYTGLLSADANQIKFYAKGSEDTLFSTIDPAEKSKPWVFFIHGFHQDPEENIKKAKKLSNHHNVNVIAFSWPSRPLDETLKGADVAETIIKDLAKRALGVATIWKLAIDAGSSYLNDTLKNYKPALENAKKSKIDLLAAIDLVENKLNLSAPPVLLVHSMGNFLLKNTMLSIEHLPMKCSNMILHQADVNAEGHDWVKKLNASLTEEAKLYITVNVHDFVLWASSQRKTLKQQKSTERLGQTRRHYVEGDIHYLDFTYGESVNNDHEFFKLSRDKSNENVFDCLNRIFNMKADELPTVAKESHAGFSKMPTEISLYQLENILDPVDDGSSDDEDLTYIKSLDRFTDPLNPVDDDEEDSGD